MEDRSMLQSMLSVSMIFESVQKQVLSLGHHYCLEVKKNEKIGMLLSNPEIYGYEFIIIIKATKYHCCTSFPLLYMISLLKKLQKISLNSSFFI